MTWETFAVAAVLVLILGGVVVYICKAKKRGVKCIADTATAVPLTAAAAAMLKSSNFPFFLDSFHVCTKAVPLRGSRFCMFIFCCPATNLLRSGE